ncbi:MAG TPA: lasso peptide biosynthesis B2 protein [Thermoanaerobaculia bacterium]|nr:lasso peptide biosynthesis B2 protein [Thermoanaerobaculia bacterium]
MKTSWWSRRPESPGHPSALRVLAFAAAVPLLLRVQRLPELPAWLEPRGKVFPPPDPETVQAAVRRIDRLLAAGRPLVRSGCLTRGLTLYWFLRRMGADVSLRFGMGTMNGSMSGHCWIVYQGEPLAERRDPRPLFTETWRIEASR